MLNFTHNTAQPFQIATHFSLCKTSFLENLLQKTTLDEYVQKLVKNAELIELFSNALPKDLSSNHFSHNENTLVAFVALYKNTDIFFISNISVIDVYTGMQLGTQLLKYTIKWTKGHGSKILKLEVAKDNTSARCFYEKFSFIYDEEREKSYFMSLQV